MEGENILIYSDLHPLLLALRERGRGDEFRIPLEGETGNGVK
jgi:hypothetical protein